MSTISNRLVLDRNKTISGKQPRHRHCKNLEQCSLDLGQPTLEVASVFQLSIWVRIYFIISFPYTEQAATKYLDLKSDYPKLRVYTE